MRTGGREGTKEARGRLEMRVAQHWSEACHDGVLHASRFAARAREGWDSAGDGLLRAPVTVRTAPSTASYAGWAAIAVGADQEDQIIDVNAKA